MRSPEYSALRLTIIFLLAWSHCNLRMYSSSANVFVLVSLLVCLIPTTSRAFVGHRIAGMDRLVQYNVLAMSAARSSRRRRQHPAPGQDRTITLGNRQATEFITAPTSRRAAGRRSATLLAL